MPTYDYECQKCGNVFEVFHGMSESPKVKCTKKACGGTAKKQIGAGSGLIFKGSGFYITDYKNKGSSNGGASAAKGESAAESKSEAKSEAKAESKPAKTEKPAKPPA